MAEQNDDSADKQNILPFSEEHIVDKKGAVMALICMSMLIVIVVVAIRGGVLR